MTQHRTGTREEWLAKRLELLAAEKELTRRGDELAQRRQALPWAQIDKEYRFETRLAHRCPGCIPLVRVVLLQPLRPGSRVVVISSAAAVAGSPLSGGYAGAKATQRFITASPKTRQTAPVWASHSPRYCHGSRR